MIEEKISKAKVLIEALPYIKKFSGETIVVKYGGSLMVNDALKPLFAQNIVLLRYVGINIIIVHGGGKEISRWMNRVGKEAVFVDGQRFTDSETMEITEMVVSGKINSEVVGLINQQGGRAVTLSGKSANLFTARRIRSKKNEDLGFVGSIEKVDTSLLHTLCNTGYIPVISPVSCDENGNSLNLNADNVAAGIAIAMEAKKLIYLTDVDGLITDGTLNEAISYPKAKALMSHPDVGGGMLPKMECALRAIENGVSNVHIINGTHEHSVLLELFTDIGIGTMISEQ